MTYQITLLLMSHFILSSLFWVFLSPAIRIEVLLLFQNQLYNILGKKAFLCLLVLIVLHKHRITPFCGTSIFPGIAGRQTGKKNDQHALLIPLRSESYT